MYHKTNFISCHQGRPLASQKPQRGISRQKTYVHKGTCIMCKLHYPQIPSSLQSISVMYGMKPTLLLLIDLMDCESKVNDFPPTTGGRISLHHSSPLTIHPANGNNGIYHQKRHPQNNGNTGGTVIDSDWILFRNPGQEKKRAEPDATGSRFVPPKKSIKCHHEGWMAESAGVNMPVCMRASLILDRAAKQMECQRNTAVSAPEPAADNPNIRKLKAQ